MAVNLPWINQQFPNLQHISPLDDGGQKSVFTAYHPLDGKIVLKLFHLGGDDARAMREIEAVSTINSPRVPRILESGVINSNTGDIVWVREQFIEGETLRNRLQRGPFGSEEILRIGLHILEALYAAEQARIVHRDIKPENIIISPDGSAWLLDFGIARHLDKTALTPLGPWGIGTPGYAPPEQFRNVQPVQDARTDLFAVGVTLFECIEGVNPFRAGARDEGEILYRVENLLLPPISHQLDSENQLRDLILSMTRVKITQRPTSIEEAYLWMKDICDKENVH